MGCQSCGQGFAICAVIITIMDLYNSAERLDQELRTQFPWQARTTGVVKAQRVSTTYSVMVLRRSQETPSTSIFIS